MANWPQLIKQHYNKEYPFGYFARSYTYDTQYSIINSDASQRYLELKNIVDTFSRNHILLDSALDMILEVFPLEMYSQLIQTKTFKNNKIVTMDLLKDAAFEVLDHMDSVHADQYWNEPYYDPDKLHNYIIDANNQRYPNIEELSQTIIDNPNQLLLLVKTPTLHFINGQLITFDYDIELFRQIQENLEEEQEDINDDLEQIIIDHYLSKL